MGLGAGDRPAEKTASTQAINYAMEAIANNQDQDLAKWLGIMPLDKLDKNTSDLFLAMLLTQTWEYRRNSLVPIIMTAWEIVYPREERTPFYAVLFTIDLLSAKLLRFVVVDSVKGATFVTTINSLLTFHFQDVAIACDKAWLAFGQQSAAILETLLNVATAEENSPITNFIKAKLVLVSDYAPIPGWVKDFRVDPVGRPVTMQTDVNSLPSYEETLYVPPEIQVRLPSDRDIVELRLRGLRDSGFSVEDEAEAKSRLEVELSLMTEDEKMEMIRPVLLHQAGLSRQNDLQLIRLYGPVSITVNATPIEMRYGGERMFTSLIFNDLNDDDGEGEPISDWFIGSCYQCNLQLRRRWHAVRIPNVSGGWTGCYCSWTCARRALLEPQSYDGGIVANPLVMGLIDQIEAQIRRVGIQDRRDDGDILPDVESVDFIEGSNIVLELATQALLNPQLVESAPSLAESALAGFISRQSAESLST